METSHDESSTSEGLRRSLREARLNRSKALRAILTAFQAQPDRSFRAIDIVMEQGILPGSVYPILRKLERQGFVTIASEGVQVSTSILTYRLTDGGALFAARYLSGTRPPMDRSGVREFASNAPG